MSKLLRTLIFTVLLYSMAASSLFAGNYEEGKLYRHKLDNGLEVLTIERHIAPLIYHQLTYKVGARNEVLGITGISHVVEHMMFKGTPKFEKGETSKLISKNSGIFNAFTSNDMTSYYEYLPKNKIDLAFDIESDRMQNCVFDEDEFASEIEVIIQERRMRSESGANGVYRENLNSVVYQSHPNRDPVIGWPEDLRGMTRDQAYDYYKTYYTPNNAFLVLVGDFDTDEIMEKVENYYGHIPAGPEVKELRAVDQEQKVRKSFTLKHNDVTTPYFSMVFHAPLYISHDAAALKIGGMILCEKSRSARLYKRLVDEEKVATTVSGGSGMSKDPSLFSIGVSLKEDSNMDSVEAMIWEEIEKMQTEPVDDKELQKVKNRYKFAINTSYVKNADIGTRLSRYEAFFGADYVDSVYNNMLAVTKEDIIAVMNKYFSPEKVTVGIMLPKEGGEKIAAAGEEAEEETLELTDDRFFYNTPVDPLNIFELPEDISGEDIIRPNPIAPMIKEHKLSNGIKLFTIENNLTPDIGFYGTISTGIQKESIEGGKPGVSSILGDVMSRGSKNYSYEDITETMAFVPFSFKTHGSYRSFAFEGYSLVDDVEEMLNMGTDILFNPLFDQEQVDKVKERHAINAKNRMKSTGMKAFYHLYNTIFKDHPYTKVFGSEEEVNSVTREDLLALHKKYFRPENTSMLVTGDMTHDEMVSLAEKYFGSWKAESETFDKFEAPDVDKLEGKEISVFTDKDYTECTINIGFAPYSNISPEESEIVSALNYIIAGSTLTSRIGIELRDKQGLIYGIKSERWAPNDGNGYWKFNTKTGPQNTEKVIKGIFTELKKLLDEGITDEELEAAKNRQLGLIPFYIETPDDVASIVYSFIKDEIPFDHFDKKTDRILNITKDDIMKVAEKYFTLDNFIIVVDGPIEENSLDHLLNEL